MLRGVFGDCVIVQLRFAGLRSWRFLSVKLSANTELNTKHEASFNN